MWSLRAEATPKHAGGSKEMEVSGVVRLGARTSAPSWSGVLKRYRGELLAA